MEPTKAMQQGNGRSHAAHDSGRCRIALPGGHWGNVLNSENDTK